MLYNAPQLRPAALCFWNNQQALCINESVLALGAPSLINERCLDLQKPGSSGSKKAAVAAAAPAGGSGTAGPQARKVGACWEGSFVVVLCVRELFVEVS